MFLNAGTTDKIFQQSGKQDSFRQILSLVQMKVQAGSSLEQPLEYNQEKMLLKNHLFHQPSYKNSIQFQISSRRQSR